MLHAGRDLSHLEADPGGHKRHAGNRCGGGIDDVGKLLTGYAQLVSNLPHRVANDQNVGIVVKEDDETEYTSRHLCPLRRTRKRNDLVDHPLHAAVPRNDSYHATNHKGEKDDRRVVGISYRLKHVHLKSVK